MKQSFWAKTIRRFSFGALGVLLGATAGLWWTRPDAISARAATRPSQGRLAPELVGREWLNTPQNSHLTLAARRGQVTIVEFWSAEDVNSRANLPVYARWQQQFGAQGVKVVGVHTPVTAQERSNTVVQSAIKARAISYPVLLDSSGANWKRWQVRSWPTLYLVDGQNRIRARWVGQIGTREKEFTQVIAALVSESAGKTKPGATTRREVVKTDAEWRKTLTPAQYDVLRNHGTESAFSGDYQSHGDGVYVCAGCGQQLFTADTKFDSGTGWPSFYEPIEPGAVEEKRDSSYGMVRTEVLCSRCQGHLGHVFDDGPRPTGLRYCMNSVAMRFEKDGAATKK